MTVPGSVFEGPGGPSGQGRDSTSLVEKRYKKMIKRYRYVLYRRVVKMTQKRAFALVVH